MVISDRINVVVWKYVFFFFPNGQIFNSNLTTLLVRLQWKQRDSSTKFKSRKILIADSLVLPSISRALSELLRLQPHRFPFFLLLSHSLSYLLVLGVSRSRKATEVRNRARTWWLISFPETTIRSGACPSTSEALPSWPFSSIALFPVSLLLPMLAGNNLLAPVRLVNSCGLLIWWDL